MAVTQYPLPLAHAPRYTAENFIRSGCNETAWQWVHAWPDWPSKALLLHGPAGCGKTHLAQLWLARAGAQEASGDALPETPPAAAGAHWLIEDIERGSDERRLFHWLNYVREQGGTLLLTSRLPAAALPFTLKDVSSRLLALPAAEIQPPDDAVLEGVLRKQAIDRQLALSEEVIAYLLPRMERSLAAAGQLLARIDTASLAQQRRVTVPLVRQLLEA
ncbi:MAG: hypothetical protein EBV03_06385 [Proteobacteria bacterium]|nr:hypothetical protein [Pseudomonadota bacterium]